MRAPSLLVAFAVIAPLQWVGAQGRVYVDDRLPPASIELRPRESPVTPRPWQLPKHGDPLYDAKKEAEIRTNSRSHLARVFERGVFKGYETVRAVSARQLVKFNESQLVGGYIPKRPEYPYEARSRGIKGSGVYILHINSETGEVTSVAVLKSTGAKLLDDSVITACAHWRFKPHTVIDVWFPITFWHG